jgi:hypothetical protein
MKILVACEESQEVCKAFRMMGHEAYSCDIEPCSGGHPEWHIQVDALELLKMRWLNSGEVKQEERNDRLHKTRRSTKRDR